VTAGLFAHGHKRCDRAKSGGERAKKHGNKKRHFQALFQGIVRLTLCYRLRRQASPSEGRIGQMGRADSGGRAPARRRRVEPPVRSRSACSAGHSPGHLGRVNGKISGRETCCGLGSFLRCPAPSRRGEPVNFATLSDHAHATVVSMRSVSDRLEALRAGALVDCCDRQIRGCLNSSPARNHETPSSVRSPSPSIYLDFNLKVSSRATPSGRLSISDVGSKPSAATVSLNFSSGKRGPDRNRPSSFL
jgi:hypothetical protein